MVNEFWNCERSVVSCMRLAGAGWVRRVKEIEIIRKVCTSLKKSNMGKLPGIDGICEKLLKHGCEAAVEWITCLFRLAWESSNVPEDWKRSKTESFYERKRGRLGVKHITEVLVC